MSNTVQGVQPYPDNLAHLGDELARAACLLRAHLLQFRLAAPEAQRERFWHLSDDSLDSLALDDGHSPLGLFDTRPELAMLRQSVVDRRARIDERLALGRAGLRLPALTAEYGLAPAETDALLLAMLAALHATYRHWYAILQREPAHVQPSAGLVAEMLSTSGADVGRHLAQLAPGGTLAANRLVVLGGSGDDPLAVRRVAIADRIALHLLGDDAPDDRAAPALRWQPPPASLSVLPLANENAVRIDMLPHLRAAEPACLPGLRLRFSGPDPQLAVDAAAHVAAGLDMRLLVFDVALAVHLGLALPLAAELALREARLGGALPFFSRVDVLLESLELRPVGERLLRALAAFPHPAAIDLGTAGTGTLHLEGEWLPFRFDLPNASMREALWCQRLAGGGHAVDAPQQTAHELARAFQLTSSQIGEAWSAARALARHRNVFLSEVTADDLFAGCRQQSARQLVAFAERIEPRRGLRLDSDIVLPLPSMTLLRELRARIRHHGKLHGAMGLGEHMRLGRGVIALFVGGSGTGKTMAAEVLASEHQVDLYRVDLASLVSKWVGETEKNLARVFADAERANCMLFFDECDAMFGKRGAVKEAHDRWANLEVNYLLQRIEDYAGVVILATNLRQNIDDAFQRRIHVVVEFPAPDAAARHAIWARLLPGGDRRAVSEDEIGELAQRFDLSGGNIRNIVVDACYRALADGRERVTVRDLGASIAREYQKMSRSVTRGEFGPFYQAAMQDVVEPVAPAGAS
jgi:hypothetical protein